LNCKGCDLSVALGFKEPDEGEARDRSQMRIREYVGKGMEEISKHIIYPTKLFPINKELGQFIINHSFQPYVKGHLVIQPIRCHNPSDQICDIDKSTIASLFDLTRKVSKALNESLKPERVYIWSFNEQHTNSPNWHLHIHIAPRNPSCKYRGPEWLFQKDKCSERVGLEEIERIVSGIRKELQWQLDECCC